MTIKSLDSALKTIKKFDLLQQGDKVVVAVSGGPDSVALWHFLLRLKPTLDLQLRLAHLNHSLRAEESSEDALFAERLAQDTEQPYTIETKDVAAYAQQNKLSIHEAARKLRYEFLYNVAEKHNANKIAIAHNADDQAETVLMRLLRGSGPEGLRAIQAKSGVIIRPFLETTRREIMEFIDENNFSFRTDSSNLKTKYLRNKIRHELLPVIKRDYNPNICQNLAQLADILREEEYFWDSYLPGQMEKIILSQESDKLVLDTQVLMQMHPALQRRLCRRAIEQIKGDLQGINYGHIEQILAVIQEEKGEKYLNLPHQLEIIKSYNKLEIRKYCSCLIYQAQHVDEKYPLQIPGELIINELRLSAQVLSSQEVSFGNSNIAYFDRDMINQPLYVRSRRPGDRFTPLGMSESKKLKNFLIDNKVPQNLRDRISLVMAGEEIIWVVGIAISEKVKITAVTKNVLCIQAHQL